LYQKLVVAAALQLLFHFMDGMRPPHQRTHGDVIQLRFVSSWRGLLNIDEE